MPVASELPIDTSASAMEMAEAMFGSGISIESASYTGADSASGIYSDGDTVAPVLTPSDTGVILSTGQAADVTRSSGDPNRQSNESTNHGLSGDSDLNEIAGAQTYDAAIFEATFVPEGSVLTMQVTFSSEEYLEYVNSGFNDAVGVWVNGEKAELTVGDGDITINNINTTSNSNLYVDNPADNEVANTEMDGFTVTMTLKANVIPDEENTIKIAIADGGDSVYDSNLMIAGDSIQTALVANDDTVTMSPNYSETFGISENDVSTTGATLTITHIGGQEVIVGEPIVLGTGETITVNADGTVTIETDGDLGSNVFSYTVEDSDGNTDVGFVTVITACFVAGTMILTVNGEVAVEALETGDMVLTRDNGFQPIRWIGSSECVAKGKDAPIRFEAGALGQHEVVEFSQNHRVLINSPSAGLLFGENEVLVKAKDLVNDKTIRRREDSKPVKYVHMLFDRHEIVRGNGLDSESYHPGRETLDGFDQETRDEILRLMPNMDAMMGYGYGPTARISLRKHEAKALLRN
ncbi:choice-of-anchor L domain-containing protein [Shimia thalassica]|uniref:choice-of-anchor L domain-containing protein n=1 Tax=Shimia thalassica TaxID=1715693 RepID=UPI0026E14F16|nr:choice-of-anchor L domain-containing protein [Shimia thalassica]MDO6485435.1 choice-of-anchor L domain-containing protein [Shimia thalassica]